MWAQPHGLRHQHSRPISAVGYLGLLQPLADGLKLFVKETVLPTNANIVLFVLAPLITFILSLISWAVIPFSFGNVIAYMVRCHSG